MAKKKEQQFDADQALKRREKYIQACEGEKKGKATVLSIIGFSVLCFIIILVVVLKLMGVGTTVVFDPNGKTGTTVYTDDNAQGTTLADYVADEISEATSQQN
jgi:Na+-transporting methylmalonyl-CoA/oxaloacetate decarboxylase gamma subunit